MRGFRVGRLCLCLAAFLASGKGYALDCTAIATSARTLKLSGSLTVNGRSGPPIYERIERGEHTLVTNYTPDGRPTKSTEYDGLVARWSKSFRDGFTQQYAYSDVHGQPASLEEGAISSWTLEGTMEGRAVLSVRTIQKIGSHGTVVLSDCPVRTVDLHREISNEARQQKTNFDLTWSPDIGSFVAFSVRVEGGDNPQVQSYLATSLEIEN
jgi:hypothetical protein